MSLTKRLIRKCWCGNTLVVDVSQPIVMILGKNCLAYRDLEVVNVSCYLSKVTWSGAYHRKHRKSLRQTNRYGFRAVFCKCGSIKHLSKFVEPKF